MPRVGPLRHIPPWEWGWQPPTRFTERCPVGVECCVDHAAEWDYAQEIAWLQVARCAWNLAVQNRIDHREVA